MKRALLFLFFSFVGLGAILDPISLQLTPPTGSVVSNTVTITATASSSVSTITKVEFYRDGVLIGVRYNPQYLPTPTNLTVTR